MFDLLVDTRSVNDQIGQQQREVAGKNCFVVLVIIEEKAENSKEEVESKKGDEKVQFDCKVLGSPPPTIIWKKDNAAINGKDFLHYLNLSGKSR